MVAALWLMALGFAGLYRAQPAAARPLVRLPFALVCAGWAVMMIGTALEFWVFTDLPYGAMNARAWSWISVLLGMLGMLIGAVWWGRAAQRAAALPVWLTGLLMALLPIELIQTMLLQFALGLLVPTAALTMVMGAWLLVIGGAQPAAAPALYRAPAD
jgi:hypothetical protein